ncbi:hypothetical protein F5878DRAFT_531472 [Lentinula raphanica]|uniref:Uncharacterized protein n=1 Tax=Lentinula raphanica TaxID=153919 RepID=A0AA38UH19_9AGAR|nr:hypothetical protein F5878DRAFT_531472 [Lentinula raphanica]
MNSGRKVIAIPILSNLCSFLPQQSLEEAHGQVEELLQQNKDLRKKQADLEAQLLLAKRTKSKSSTKSTKADDGALNHELMLKLGKRYAIMVFPWPNPSFFMTPPDMAALKPEEPARFETEESYYNGSINELHAYLNDPNLSKLAATYGLFRTEFLGQVKQGRTSAIHTVRESASIIMAGIDVPVLAWEAKAGAAIRKESSTLKALLAFSGKSVEDEKEIFSPIHFPGAQLDFQKIFLNEFQPKV